MTADAPDTNLLLADAYEGIEDASVYVKDLDGRYLMINAAGATFAGLEPDQVVGKTDVEVFPEYAAVMREADEAVIADDASSTFEEALIAEGELRTFLTTKAPLRDGSGAVIGLIGISTDITKRRAAEERLRQRETALAEAQAVAGVGSWETDLVGDVRQWSDQLYRIFGVDPDDFEPTFESTRAFIHPDDRQRVDAAFDQSRHDGADFECEYRIVRPDGEVRTIMARARTFTDLDGEPIRMVGAALDITERRAAAEKLRRREATLAESQAVAKVGSWDRDLVSGTLEWSEEMYRMLGLDPEEFEPTFESFVAAIHPDDRELLKTAVDEAGRTGTSFEVEYRIIRPDDEVRTLLARGRCFLDADGEPVRTVGAVVDLTERKVAEEKLRQREAALAEAQAVSGVGSWETDLVSGTQRWSDGLYRLIGVDPTEYEPTLETAPSFIHPDDRERVMAAFDRSRQAGGYFESEYRIVRPDGEVRSLIARARTFTDPDGEAVRNVGAALDITERKAAEEQLRQREAAMSQAQAVAEVGSWETDLFTGVRRWSDQLKRIFGLAREASDPTYDEAMALVHPEDRERVAVMFKDSLKSGVVSETEYRIVRPDGETRTVRARARCFMNDAGEPVRIIGAALDITERKRSHDLLQARQALLNTAQELSKVGGFEWDVVADEVTWSEGLNRIFGLELGGEGAGTFEGYLELVPPEDRDERRRKIEQVLETGEPASDEYRIVRPDGKVRWIESRITALTDSEGKRTRLVGACQDVTERKAGVQQLERDLQAARSRPLRDSLTHLANRTLALDRLEHAFDLAKLAGSDLSVVLIDVDGFTELNENHGQLLGDSVLMLVAERLRSSTRESDTLARVGSDEFLVVCEEVDLAAGTLPTTENLREAFSSPLVLDRTRETIEITFSIGSSSIGDRTVPSARRLLDQAEEALARARGRGPGSYAHHSGDPAKTNGHRAASSIELLNAEPAETNGKPAERSPTEELVRHMYDLWGPGKPDEWISCFHDEIEYIPSAGLSGFDAIYRGHEGMRRFWSHKEDGWESTEVVLLHFEERGDNFVVFVLASLVMKGTGAQIEVSLHQGGKMRDGLIYRLGGYESRTEAFQALEARD